MQGSKELLKLRENFSTFWLGEGLVGTGSPISGWLRVYVCGLLRGCFIMAHIT